MAAGLGFKDFVTGEVLTAADVDGYLMQGIWVFATTAARDAAVTAPAEGNFAFTKDTNSLWYYDGAVWVASGATGDIEGVTAGTGISGGGTSGTVTITNSMATAIDAKGDLIVGTGADTFSKLTAGTNTYVLTADSSEATGLKWAAPAGGSFVGVGVKLGTTQSISNNTFTSVSWASEDFDTDSFWALSPNPTRITIPSGKGGKYLFTGTIVWALNATGDRGVQLAVTGTGVGYVTLMGLAATTDNFTRSNFSAILDLTAADYVTVNVWQGSGGSLNIAPSSNDCRLQVQYLGA